MTEYDVVIAGAGPTGLMLAGELALGGVRAALVEPRPDHQLIPPRSRGLHARTLEVLEQRGLADRFLAAGKTAQVAGFAWMPLDIGDFPTRHNYGLALAQTHVERLLAEWVEELGVPRLGGCAVEAFTQGGGGVDVELSDGRTLRAQHLVGCDGGRSRIRKAAGIGFPGHDASISNLMAEVHLTETPTWGLRHDALGVHSLSPAGDGAAQVLVTEPAPGETRPPDLARLRAAMTAVFGSDFGAHSPRWITRFTDAARQAQAYRAGRVLLAGDAAHIHYPAGGQGLNLGMQDAVNLGWKLAQVVKGQSPEALLDTYQAERHPVAARVLRNAMAQVALLGRLDDRKAALREVFAELLEVDGARRRLAGMMSGLDVRYDLGDGHPLLGRRMPDLDLVTAQGPTPTYALLHDARPLLLDFGAGLEAAAAPWRSRVRRVEAAYEGEWELPVLGAVSAPSAVLVRPDGHVAWVGAGTCDGLAEALHAWFGAPA